MSQPTRARNFAKQASETAAQFAAVKKAIEAGKHVYCEEPTGVRRPKRSNWCVWPSKKASNKASNTA